MFCQFCGSPIDATATVCPKCGKEQPRARAAAATAAAGGNFGARVGDSAKDALNSFVNLIVNPVGGLAPAFTGLGPDRALGAGLVFSVLFALISALGLTLGDGAAVVSFLFLAAGFGVESEFGLFIRAFVALLMIPAAMIGVAYGLRKVLSGSGPLAADAFTVGAALTPFGIAFFLANILSGSPELASLLMLFGMTYVVLILYAGLTRLGGLTEKTAAPAVPVIFVVSLYICQVVFRALTN
jgi:hypothetical protein